MTEIASGRPGNQEVRDQTVRLDYQTFEGKSFIRCQLLYAGGTPPTLINCDFINCRFILEGPAQATAQFLRDLATEGGAGGRNVVAAALGVLENG